MRYYQELIISREPLQLTNLTNLNVHCIKFTFTINFVHSLVNTLRVYDFRKLMRHIYNPYSQTI